MPQVLAGQCVDTSKHTRNLRALFAGPQCQSRSQRHGLSGILAPPGRLIPSSHGLAIQPCCFLRQLVVLAVNRPSTPSRKTIARPCAAKAGELTLRMALGTIVATINRELLSPTSSQPWEIHEGAAALGNAAAQSMGRHMQVQFAKYSSSQQSSNYVIHSARTASAPANRVRLS